MTLIEKIIVCAIVGILSAIAAPSWIGFLAAREVSTTADKIQQSIYEAKSEAGLKKLNVEIAIAKLPYPTGLAVQLCTHDGNCHSESLNSNISFSIRRAFIPRCQINNLSPDGTKCPITEFDFLPSTKYLGSVCITYPGRTRDTKRVVISTLLGATRQVKNKGCNSPVI